MHKSCARFRFRRYYVMLCEIHIVRDTPGELSQHHTRTKSTEGCLNILQLTEIRFLFRFSTRLEVFSTRVKTAGVWFVPNFNLLRMSIVTLGGFCWRLSAVFDIPRFVFEILSVVNVSACFWKYRNLILSWVLTIQLRYGWTFILEKI